MRALAKQGPFVPNPTLAGTIGCKAAELAGLIRALGYRIRTNPAGDTPELTVGARRRHRPEPPPPRPAREAADSPFAKLKEHQLARR